MLWFGLVVCHKTSLKLHSHSAPAQPTNIAALQHYSSTILCPLMCITAAEAAHVPSDEDEDAEKSDVLISF